MMKKITVIGATGMIGIPVTRELIKAGFEVTALVRNTTSAKQLFPQGVNFVKGDIEQISSIAEAIKQADGVYINISTRATDKENQFSPEKQGLENILQALKNSQVKQVAYLSSFLARNYTRDWWVMNAKKQGIEKVKNCGIPYTIFYPSNFMENFASEGMRRGNKVNFISSSVNNKAWWIAGEDFGRQVANAFKTEKALHTEYAVQGPEPLTMQEAAAKYASAYTKEKLGVGSMPFGLLKFLGFCIPQMKFVANLMNVMLNNEETFESQKTWDELGKSTISIVDFAKRG